MPSLRDRMPVAAWLIDQLRKRWGVEATDALVRRAMRGQAGQEGALYIAELNEAGELLEFGCTRDGRRVVMGDGGGLVWVDAESRTIPLAGPPKTPTVRVIRAPNAAQLPPRTKGVVS